MLLSRKILTMFHSVFQVTLFLFYVAHGTLVTENVGSLRHFFGYESGAGLDVVFSNNNQDYGINVNGEEWFVSGLTSFRNKGDWALVSVNRSESHSGSDNFGTYNDFTIFWQDSNDLNVQMATGFRTYPDNPDTIVFTQTFVNGMSARRSIFF